MAGSEYAQALIRDVMERQEALAEEDSEMAEEEDTRHEESDENEEEEGDAEEDSDRPEENSAIVDASQDVSGVSVSAQLRNILALPEVRQLEAHPRYGTLRENRSSYNMANAVYTRGNEATTPCAMCAKAFSTDPGKIKPAHPKCVVMAGKLKGSCTNCHYNNRKLCSFRMIDLTQDLTTTSLSGNNNNNRNRNKRRREDSDDNDEERDEKVTRLTRDLKFFLNKCSEIVEDLEKLGKLKSK